jgi:hypothetical protein
MVCVYLCQFLTFNVDSLHSRIMRQSCFLIVHFALALNWNCDGGTLCLYIWPLLICHLLGSANFQSDERSDRKFISSLFRIKSCKHRMCVSLLCLLVWRIPLINPNIARVHNFLIRAQIKWKIEAALTNMGLLFFCNTRTALLLSFVHLTSFDTLEIILFRQPDSFALAGGLLDPNVSGYGVRLSCHNCHSMLAHYAHVA